MFTVIFHDEAEKEFTALPPAIRAKMARLLMKLKQTLVSYASQIPSRLDTAFSKYVQWGQISPAESGYIRVVNVFFYFGSLSKNRQKRPRQK